LLEGQGPNNPARLPIGQSFRARLVDSLFWDGTGTQMRGLAELLEPIASRDGDELAPAGSLVIVNLAHPSAAGVVKLAAEALVVLGSEEDLEIPLPPKALLVRAPDGMPLMAQRLEGGDSPEVDEGINWGGLLFDVARTGAEFGLGGSGSNAYRDIYRYQRLESLYNRYFGQPPASAYNRPLPRQSNTTWLLPAGLEVQLYVNQSFEFGIRNSEFGIGNELRGTSAAEFGIGE
jgi:hypothetical protein